MVKIIEYSILVQNNIPVSIIAKMVLHQNGLVKVICAPVASNYASLMCALLNMLIT